MVYRRDIYLFRLRFCFPLKHAKNLAYEFSLLHFA